MKARIFKPSKTAMQSGLAKTKEWTLVFEPGARQFIEPLMGWSGQVDTNRQVQLWFDTQEEAVQYATQHGLAFELALPKARTLKPKAYADNFRYDRVEFTDSEF